MCCSRWHLGWLPVSVTLVLLATILTTYTIAVARGDVRAVFPYISSTGGYGPESCIFTLGLSTTAVLGILTIFLRYRDVARLIQRHRHLDCKSIDKLTYLNDVSLWLGIAMFGGMLVIGAFQNTRVLVMHLVGVCLSFPAGVAWEAVQVYVSFTLQHSLATWRLGLLASSFCFGALYTFAGWASHYLSPGIEPGHWDPSMQGFAFHVASAVGEWLLAVTYISFFCTLWPDFSRMTVEVHVSDKDIESNGESSAVAEESTALLAGQ